MEERKIKIETKDHGYIINLEGNPNAILTDLLHITRSAIKQLVKMYNLKSTDFTRILNEFSLGLLNSELDDDVLVEDINYEE